MKQKFLNLKGINEYKKPLMITNRRMKLMRHSMTAAYKTDGDPADPADAEKVALLNKIKDTVKTECETQGFKKETDINAMIQQALSGLDVEALKKFKIDEIQTSVRNVASAIDKINQARASQTADGKKVNALKEVFKNEKFLNRVQQLWDRKEGVISLDAKQAADIMTTATAVDYGSVTIPEDILESFSVDTLARKRFPREYIYDVASRRTVPKITEYKTWLEEGDIEGAFAIVAEGGLKPLVSAELVRNISKYRKVAGKRVYTEEFAKFRQEVYNIIEDILNDKLLRDYADILTVDLLTWAGAYVSSALDAQFDEPTDYHAIAAAAAQIEALNFVPDLLVLNPQDKWRIGMQQGTDGHFFINIPMINPSGQVQMLGFRVVTSNKITAGTFLLGESGLYKIEDEPITVRLGYGVTITKDGANVTDVQSDVDHNRFRIIAELFFHDYVATNHTGAFVEGDFDDIKTALTAP